MRALFDTNILIDYLEGLEPAKEEFERHPGRLVSIVSWMELLAGAHGEEEEDVIGMFLREFRVVDVTRAIAREAVAIRSQKGLRLPDAIIWATAHVESALLITRNAKDFPADAPGIRVPY